MSLPGMRVGLGHDIHRLVPGKTLVLGGVDVPASAGFDTHSDGDVLSHALVDAMAGAITDGDLGTHFPEDDPKAKDARSLDFVAQFSRTLTSHGYRIVSIDSFIVLGTTRLRPHLATMARNISDAIGISLDLVSVKARSNDGLGPEGEGRAASATAIVLVQRCGPTA